MPTAFKRDFMPTAFKRDFMPTAFNPDGVFGGAWPFFSIIVSPLAGLCYYRK